MSWKHLFSRSLAARPEVLHFAAHSHHLWPDASRDGQLEAWEDAARLADDKWDHIMGPIWEEAQGHVARELCLPDPATIVFAPNTHDLLLRLVSALPSQRPRVLASDGEFHSFRRQAARWVEAGVISLETVPIERLAARAGEGAFDLVFASQVQFASGRVLQDFGKLASVARPEGPWVVIDGYHGFMATPTDLSAVADRVFYLAGGYKYAMAGEGCGFLHAPPGFGPRPVVTGWYAAFDQLAEAQSDVTYAPDARRFMGATFDPSGLYRFNAVQRMLRIEGLSTASISAHVRALQDRFLEAANLAGLSLRSDRSVRFLALVGERSPRLHRSLRERGVVTDLRGDVLRIGFGLYHDAEDIDRLVDAFSAAQA